MFNDDKNLTISQIIDKYFSKKEKTLLYKGVKLLQTVKETYAIKSILEYYYDIKEDFTEDEIDIMYKKGLISKEDLEQKRNIKSKISNKYVVDFVTKLNETLGRERLSFESLGTIERFNRLTSEEARRSYVLK